MPGGRPRLTEEEKARRAAEKAMKPKGKPGRPKKEKPPPKAVGRPVKTLTELAEEIREAGVLSWRVKVNTPIQFNAYVGFREVTHALPKHVAKFQRESEENAMAREDGSPAALADLKARRMLPKTNQRAWYAGWVVAHPDADPHLVNALRHRIEAHERFLEEQAEARRKEREKREAEKAEALASLKALEARAFPSSAAMYGGLIYKYASQEAADAARKAQAELKVAREAFHKRFPEE